MMKGLCIGVFSASGYLLPDCFWRRMASIISLPVRLALLLVACLVHLTAQAQEWPAKPVRFVVPFPPGGAADALPRIFAEKLGEKWKQPFVIENRAGATGTIGAELVYRAEPDGYTFLATPPSTLVLNPSLYAQLPYDATQFVPVAVMAE